MNNKEIFLFCSVIGLFIFVIILSWLILDLDSRVDQLIITQEKIIIILEGELGK